MFIYLIVNHITGKYYVGQHKGNNLKQYLQKKFYEANCKKGNSYLYASIRKHGREVFSIHPLLSDIQTRVELDQIERDFISFLKSQDPEFGYNICRGGEGFSGPHSSRTREKISAAAKEMWKRPEIRESITTKMIGHPTSLNVLAALHARKGTKASAETKEKLRISHIGKVRSEESRRKQSQSVTGANNHFYGKKHSAETSMRIIAANSIPVRCLDTNEMFSSLKIAAESVGGLGSNLSRAIRHGWLYFGKRFEYAE